MVGRFISFLWPDLFSEHFLLVSGSVPVCLKHLSIIQFRFHAEKNGWEILHTITSSLNPKHRHGKNKDDAFHIFKTTVNKNITSSLRYRFTKRYLLRMFCFIVPRRSIENREVMHDSHFKPLLYYPYYILSSWAKDSRIQWLVKTSSINELMVWVGGLGPGGLDS